MWQRQRVKGRRRSPQRKESSVFIALSSLLPIACLGPGLRRSPCGCADRSHPAIGASPRRKSGQQAHEPRTDRSMSSIETQRTTARAALVSLSYCSDPGSSIPALSRGAPDRSCGPRPHPPLQLAVTRSRWAHGPVRGHGRLGRGGLPLRRGRSHRAGSHRGRSPIISAGPQSPTTTRQQGQPR